MSASNKNLGAEQSAGLCLRFAKRDDAPLIHRMVAELAAFLGDSDMHVASAADYAEHGFGETAKFECVIADYQSQPVGMCLFFGSFSTWTGKPGIYVQDLYISDKARGLGLGKKLLAHVARIGVERGCGYLRLSVDAGNASAQAFYQACGLEWSRSEQIFTARGAAFPAIADIADADQQI